MSNRSQHTICYYKWQGNRYKTTCCARTTSLYIDSLDEHNMKHCPYCGRVIQVLPETAEKEV